VSCWVAAQATFVLAVDKWFPEAAPLDGGEDSKAAAQMIKVFER
jgi:hypothetical protein